MVKTFEWLKNVWNFPSFYEGLQLVLKDETKKYNLFLLAAADVIVGMLDMWGLDEQV